MSTLLAHEWLATTGGSENVFEEIRLVYPGARSVCLWNDDPERFPQVAESWLSHRPIRGHKAAALPLTNLAWRSVDLTEVNRVIVSSHAFAHHLASRAAAREIPAYCYVHSPARYIWVPDLDTRGQSAPARLGRRPLQWFDRRHASSAVHYAANSHFVSQRIANAWQVKSEVIYPPVDIEAIQGVDHDLAPSDEQVLGSVPEQFVLGASRFVPYKRMECAVDVGAGLGLPVVLVGEGPDQPRVRDIAANAGVPVTFLGRVSDTLLRALYAKAALFVFMPIEDFGIMPVEAMASGTPVLVNRVGGAAESVGILCGGCSANPDSASDMRAGAERALGTDMASAVAGAVAFSRGAFRARLYGWAGHCG